MCLSLHCHPHPHPPCKHTGCPITILILAIATIEGFNLGLRYLAHDFGDLDVWVEYELCAHVSFILAKYYNFDHYFKGSYKPNIFVHMALSYLPIS